MFVRTANVHLLIEYQSGLHHTRLKNVYSSPITKCASAGPGLHCSLVPIGSCGIDSRFINFLKAGFAQFETASRRFQISCKHVICYRSNGRPMSRESCPTYRISTWPIREVEDSSSYLALLHPQGPICWLRMLGLSLFSTVYAARRQTRFLPDGYFLQVCFSQRSTLD